LYGKNHQHQLVSCLEETTLMKVKGYVGKPDNAKRTRGEQYFFVNKRYIKNNYLNHAVMSAYEGLLPEKHYPFYALFIELDPKHVDVNVHPTKTEVKFDDERTVYGIIRAAVKQALGTHNITPSLDFDSDVNFEAIINIPKSGQMITRQERAYGQMKSPGLQKEQIEHWEQLYQTSLGESKIDIEGDLPARTMGSAVNRRDQLPGVKRHTMQVLRNYIISPVRSGMMMVDYKAASERIFFEQYLQCLEQRQGASQQLLFPQSISINPADFNLIMELEADIRALGFAFEQFGKSDLVVQGVPLDAASRDVKSLFEGLLEQIKNFSSNPETSYQQQLARSMAKKVASVPDQNLQPEVMETLIDRLFGCSNPNYAPGGELTHVILDSNAIEKLFKQ
jgi:DNA mismatch repair protein MutL